MSSFAFTGIWLLVVGLLWLGPCAGWALAQGRDSLPQGFRLSHAGPTDMEDSETRLWDKIELLLSGPIQPSADLNSQAGPAVKIPFRPGWSSKHASAPSIQDLQWSRLIPGISSLRPLNEGLAKLASLNPYVPAAKRDGEKLLDFWEGFSSLPGSLVGDPVNLYSSFVVEVDRANYRVSLYGRRNGDDKSLLYTCRAGLGSAEYPTPRGTYYLLRIFDDHPIWIPPQDREWAWGQMPSRSVYGGHMLPLFMKKTGKGSDDIVEDLDCVSPPAQMVDSGGYRVHGTDSPWSIGSAQSHGCIRLLNSSVKRLADTMKMYVGTTNRGETPNGTYITLARPVKIVLY